MKTKPSYQDLEREVEQLRYLLSQQKGSNISELISKSKLQLSILPKNISNNKNSNQKNKNLINTENVWKQIRDYGTDYPKWKQTEDKLKQALSLAADHEKKFKDLFEKSKDANLIIENNLIVDCNQAALDILQVKDKNEILNFPPSLISPEVQLDGQLSKQKAKKMTQKALSEGSYRFEWLHTKMDGSVFPVEVLLTKIVANSSHTILHVNWKDITLRKKSEFELELAKKRLEEREDQFRAITEQATDGITLADQAGKYLFVNPKFCEMSGYSKEELLELTVFDMKAKNQNHNSFYKSKNSFEGIPIKVILKRKNGTEYLTEIVGKNILIGDKKLVLGTIRDITEKEKKEKELFKAKEKAEQNEQKFRDLIEKSGDAHFILSDREVSSCNEAALKMFGYDNKEEFISKEPHHFSPEKQENAIDSLKASIFMIRTTIENGTHRFEWIHKKKNGDLFPAEVVLTKIDRPNNKFIIHSIVRDISTRTKAKEDLIIARKRIEKSEAQFQAIIEQSPQSIQVFDKTGKTISVNKSWEKLWLSPSSLIVNQFNILKSKYSNKEELIPHVKQAFAGETVFTPEIIYTPKSPDGKTNPRVLKYIIFPIKIKSIVEQVIIIHQDVTEKKEYEINLLKAKEKAEEGDRLKSAFLANMSHEIRTPMNGIMGFTSLLKDTENSPEDQIEFINVIERSGHRLLGIINDLLDISKIESGLITLNNSQVNISDLLKYLYIFFKPETELKGLQLEYHKPAVEYTISCDREKFSAILTNLIKNAIKYSITGKIEFGLTKIKGFLQFYVRDEGIGIPLEKQVSIFDRFVQADNTLASSYEGAGLGLSITKAFVELMGGEIWLESEVEIGSNFYFTLPLEN